jgi:hypothetical protein
VAAVMGAEVDVAVLAAATDADVPTTLDRLDPALATGVLAEVAVLRVRFAHALLRAALLDEVPPTARRRLHARVAAALRGRSGPVTPELAHHLVEAGPVGDLPAARDAAVTVARSALARWAVDDAARWFGRALEVVTELEAGGGPDHRTRHALLLARADALFRAGQVVAAREDLAAGVDVAMVLDDLDGVASAAAALSATGGLWTWVDLGEGSPAVLALLRSVLERLGDGDSPARARLLSTVATGLYYSDDQATVDRLSAEAVSVARRLGDPSLLADVLLDRAFAIRLPERSPEVVALADEALAQPGLTELQVVVGHGRRYYGLMHAGEYPEAIEAHRRASEAAADAHLLGPQLQLGPLAIGVALAEGRLGDAERLLARERAQVERGDVPRLGTGLLGAQALLDLVRGRLDRQVDVLREVSRNIPVRPFHQMLALAHVASGDVAAARAAWEESRAAPKVQWLELMADALEVDLRVALLTRELAPGDEELLRVLGSREHMIAAAGTAYPWVPVALPLALHEHRLGLLADAERHLRDVLARSESWGTRTWTAVGRWRLAAVIAEQDPRSEEAGRLRSAASSEARDIGMALPRGVAIA